MWTRLILPLLLLLGCVPAGAVPEGLTFHVSFDGDAANADFALGERRSSLETDLGFHSAPGVKGQGMLLQRGERCSYPIRGNLDTSQGTFSCWVKPLNWDGHVAKFRHFLVVTAPAHTMLLYLYPIGDKAVILYIRMNPGTPQDATLRAGAPVDILKQGEWTHLAATWDSKAVRIYANGQRVGEGLVASPLPKLDEGTFTLCPIDFWNNKQWGDPDEQTVCDEVRIFNRALAEDEILDLYALDAPGGGKGIDPTLAVTIKPDYNGKRLLVTARPAHLDAAWKERLAGKPDIQLTVRDPKGKTLLAHRGPLGDGQFVAPVPEWADGDYVAEGVITATGERLAGRASITKPPTPWLPSVKEWRATRVLEPWMPLARSGSTIRYWNGELSLKGAFPEQLTARECVQPGAKTTAPHPAQPLLAGPVRLVAAEPATWNPPRVIEEKPYRITVAGTGRVGALAATYETLMEFDGLIRADLTLTPPAGGVELAELILEIPIRAEVATYYRNPTCREWDGKSLVEEAFLPYAWLGNEERGLSWFMESAANWRIGKEKPVMTLRREGNAVVARLHLISERVRVEKPLTYTLGLQATPVRPLPARLYDWWFASGPQFKGSNLFVFGWSKQISYLNGRLIAYDPAKQRELVDRWRASGKESLSYTCAQCTANISPEYLFFGEEWNQPYGGSFSGYKRVPDDAPYSIVPVCPQSSFADFLVWCVRENIRNDWGGGIYTDIDGAIACDNALHGCGFTDSFGQKGRTWPLYAHRALSRRIYELCHDAGKFYFSHAHSHWYAPFNAFNDGWCPGEQYSSQVVGRPDFYMTGIPDRVWRTEFYSPTTGVATFLLPQLSRLAGEDVLKETGPSESCIVAGMCYGAPLWAGSISQSVVEEVWAVQQAFGLGEAEFIPFWKQREVTVSDPQVRVSLWRKPGKRLLVVANFTNTDRIVELKAPGTRFEGAWKAEGLETSDGTARLVVPAYRGALVLMTGPDERR